MNDYQFNELSQKIDLLVRISALKIVKDLDYREQVVILDKIGFQPKEIASILGKSPNNVNVTLHLIKKKNKSNKAAKK